MENKSHKVRNTLIILVIIVAVVAAIWYSLPHGNARKFCFDFAHNMQFGDRPVAHPVNIGHIAPGGIIYYSPEIDALQTALDAQGFYIDPYESNGGKVYAGAFFGPSTRAAVLAFQKKYKLPETGQVTDATADRLAALYSCPKPAATTSAATK